MMKKMTTSSLFVKVLGIRFVFIAIALLIGNVLPPYDASGKLFSEFTRLNEGYGRDYTPLDQSIYKLLSPLSHWDGVYFTSIATAGYSIDQWHAFFPGYPVIVNQLAKAFVFIVEQMEFIPKISFHAHVLISSIVVSFISCVSSALALYFLTKKLFGNESFAATTCLLFTVNPASIFMTAAYTESTFFLCTLLGLLLLEYCGPLFASLMFACASLVRSNGMVLFGFIGHYCLKTLFNSLQNRPKSNYNFIINPILVVASLLHMVMAGVIVVAPFVLYCTYGYSQYCFGDSQPLFCSDRFPNIYNYVQDRYWNVGFMRYYTVSQIPNFVLAAPVLLLVVYSVALFCRNKLCRSSLFLLGLARDKNEILQNTQSFLHQASTVFIIHLIGATAVLLPFLHIQVLTRFLFSSSPVLHWAAAHIAIYGEKLEKIALFWYYSVFLVLGFFLFPTFLPWT